MTDVCIIGIGNVGGAVAIALSRAGYRVSQLVIHNPRDRRRVRRILPFDTEIVAFDRLKSIDADVIFISTRDPDIELVVSNICGLVRKGQVVFHTSGSRSSDILSPLAKRGCHIGSLHPLTSISDPVRGADQFAGTHFCVEGSSKAVKLGRRIIRDLGGKPFTIKPEFKPLYHAAAVTSAGQITSLFDEAVEMLSKCGVSRNDASRILLPLATSTIRNLEHQSPEDSLTGPFARLDTATFDSHIKQLRKFLPQSFLQLYLLLGERSLDLVERRSGRSSRTLEFRKRISMAKEKSR